jgi:phosphopantothenoylcysteine decarboxylase/phosphopantothenate--cysteine ligase
MAKELFNGKKILLGVTGGIAAYKSAEIVSQLTQKGACVKVIMTKCAMEFVTPLTFQTLSHNKVYTDMFEKVENYNPVHISLAEEADLVLIAPATANIIGKIAHGIADDFLSTIVMAVKCPILIAPAMNDNMYKNPIVQENISKLKKLGYVFISPEKGHLACQKIGEGRLASFDVIMEALSKAISK